jgi:hypothetical protein
MSFKRELCLNSRTTSDKKTVEGMMEYYIQKQILFQKNWISDFT